MTGGKEIGRVGQRRYGGMIYEEFLPELRGHRGIAAYTEMSENDDIVGATGMWNLAEIPRRIKRRLSLWEVA